MEKISLIFEDFDGKKYLGEDLFFHKEEYFFEIEKNDWGFFKILDSNKRILNFNEKKLTFIEKSVNNKYEFFFIKFDVIFVSDTKLVLNVNSDNLKLNIVKYNQYEKNQKIILKSNLIENYIIDVINNKNKNNDLINIMNIIICYYSIFDFLNITDSLDKNVIKLIENLKFNKNRNNVNMFYKNNFNSYYEHLKKIGNIENNEKNKDYYECQIFLFSNSNSNLNQKIIFLNEKIFDSIMVDVFNYYNPIINILNKIVMNYNFDREWNVNFSINYYKFLKNKNSYKKYIYKNDYDPSIKIVYSLDNKYHMEEFLGKGSFGEVSKAYDLEDNFYVAIKKIIEEEFDYPEIKIIKKLGQECTLYFPCFYDIFKFQNYYFIVMEYLESYINLDQFLKKFKFNINYKDFKHQEDFKIIVNNLCTGLELMHQKKVSHKDIKSANIMINIKDLNIKYIDYGFSCEEEICDIDTGRTIDHSPPEILGKKLGYYNLDFSLSITINADIWSLGCVIYNMMIGYTPLFRYKNNFKDFVDYYDYEFDDNKKKIDTILNYMNEKNLNLGDMMLEYKKGKRKLSCYCNTK